MAIELDREEKDQEPVEALVTVQDLKHQVTRRECPEEGEEDLVEGSDPAEDLLEDIGQ